MPLFEYACRHCNKEFELLLRGSEEAHCPTCGTAQVERQLSIPAAHTGSSRELPICQVPQHGGCGLPACGTGCQWER